MPRSIALPVVLPDDFIVMLKSITEEQVVFNRTLGLKITAIASDRVAARMQMRPELVGHYGTQRIHGGAISAALDGIGGLAVMAAIAARHTSETIAQCLPRFGKVSTIDLRVDYLRPGLGAEFEVQAEVLRLGSRVASVRMAFLSAEGKLLSTGAGAYMVA